MNKQGKEMKIEEMKIEEMETISGGRHYRIRPISRTARVGIDVGPVFSPTSPFGNSQIGIIPQPSL